MVGFIAGSSLAFLPPLVTSLGARSAEPSHVVLFSLPRVSLGVALAMFIAVLTTIQEYQKPGRPWSIFLRALALPGLLVGSLQSLTDNAQLRDNEQRLHAAEEFQEELTGISTISDEPEKPAARKKGTAAVPDTGIIVASVLPLDWLRIDPPQQEPRYYIVLDRRPDGASATTRAEELKPTCCPGAATLQERSGTGWYVIDSKEARSHTDALRRALVIKNYTELKLAPQLLAVER